MTRKNANQSGFGAVEICLVVVVAAIIGGVGYALYHHKTASSGNTPIKVSGRTLADSATTLYPTHQLSYRLPSNFKQTSTKDPFSGTNNVTEEYEVDINSKTEQAPQGVACGTPSPDNCAEPVASVTIQNYLLSSSSETLQQFDSVVDGPGLSGEYTTLDGHQVYCQQASDGSQKQLDALPAGVPWQVFWGYGCDFKWDSRAYQIKANALTDKQYHSDYLEAINIVQSVKLL